MTLIEKSLTDYIKTKHSAEECFGFIDGYKKCQKDMGKLSEWQLCPKCFGEGIVQNVGTSSSMYRTCPICNGNKTLIKPII